MQPQHIFVSLALYAIPALAQSLVDVLRENGLTEYAELLERNPTISTIPGLIVYAPTNAALTGNGNVTGSDTEAEIEFSQVNPTAPSFTNPGDYSGNTTNSKRQVAPSGSVYGTLLDDPEWVNLGPGRNQTIVERSVPTAPQPLVFTGLGASVSVTASDIPFDGGVIRPIDGVLTLPRNLSYTLPFLGAERFGTALQNAGLFPDLDNRAIITVLAPNDAAFGGADNLPDAQLAQVLREHVVVDFPAYTPLLQDGSTYRTLGGSNVTVLIRDNVAYINGAQILAGDAIIRNGVVHTIDRLLTAQSPTPTPSPIPTAAATTAKPLSWLALVFASVGIAVAAFSSV
ncbi:hypothetical protein DL768_001568 [Monosporascus sp. mg162]|nr:hypothetical protein DL768_001568 [Monosporascus sp. mg162]